MANITPQMVKELRARTDLPMMECKQALAECNGDMESAIEWLRKKHKGKMADRSDRETGEGRVQVHIDPSGKAGAIIALQCETAPVAKNEVFIALADAFAKKAAAGDTQNPDVEALRNDPGLDAKFTETFGKLREHMKLQAARKVTGEYLTSYVHHDGKSGILIALSARPTSENIGPDLCMHATFTKPLAIDRDGVSAATIEKVRTEAREMARAEGKPDQIVEKIAEGKVNSFYGERVLMEQLHARSDVYGKKKVRDVLKEAGVSGVTGMAFLKIGA